MSYLSHAFGPGSITCVAIVPGHSFVIDEVIDASYSEHVDKFQIRRLGHRLAVGWAVGAASLAGTLVCAKLTQGPLWKLRNYYGAIRIFGEQAFRHSTQNKLRESSRDFFASAISPTQLPPFHLMFVHMNEMGQMAIARYYNVTIVDRGGVIGANERVQEETLQYMATYEEGLRLHRSLTLTEMESLRARMTQGFSGASPFFRDYYRQETLVESLSAVSAELAKDYSLDTASGDVAGYLLSETQYLEDRIRRGEPTALGIYDRGAVTYVIAGEQADPVAKEEVPAEEAPANPTVMDWAFEKTLTEAVPFATKMPAAAQAQLIGRQGKLMVAPLGIEAAEEHVIATLRDGAPVTLTGADYYRRVLGDTTALIPHLVPDAITLVVSRHEADTRVLRTGRFSEGLPLTKADATDLSGTYEARWPGAAWTDRVVVTKNEDGYTLAGTVGPAPVGPTAGVRQGAAWRFVTDLADCVFTLSAEGGRGRLVRSGAYASLNIFQLTSPRQEGATLVYEPVVAGGADWEMTLTLRVDTEGVLRATTISGTIAGVAVAGAAPGAAPGASCRADLKDAQGGLRGVLVFTAPTNATSRSEARFMIEGRGTQASRDGVAAEARFTSSDGHVDLHLKEGVLSGQVYGAAVSGAQVGVPFDLFGAMTAVLDAGRAALQLALTDRTL